MDSTSMTERDAHVWWYEVKDISAKRTYGDGRNFTDWESCADAAKEAARAMKPAAQLIVTFYHGESSRAGDFVRTRFGFTSVEQFSSSNPR